MTTETAISSTYTPGYTPADVEGAEMAVLLSKLENYKIVGNTIHFRIKVPSDIRHLFPSREIGRSTGCKIAKLGYCTREEYEEIKERLDSLRTFAKKIFFLLTLTKSREAQQELIDQLCPKKVQQREKAIVATTQKNSGKLISEVVAEYIKNATVDQVVEKTLDEIRYSGWLLTEIVGDKPIAEVNREDAKLCKDTLLKLPPNMTKIKKYQGMSIAELVAIRDNYIAEQDELGVVPSNADLKKYAPVMSRNTVNNKLTWFSAFLSLAIRESYYTSVNPFDNLKLKQTIAPSEEKKPYTREELQLVFNNLVWDIARPERFWVTLIGIFHGVRMNQICQLYYNDIIVDPLTGLTCFKFSVDTKDKSLKTKASYKTVPMHQYLIDCGLLDLFDHLKKSGQPRIWTNLYLTRGTYSHGLSKWFCDKFNPAIIADNPNSNASFHSLRHNVINLLKQKLTPMSLISALVGQENKSTEINDTSITNLRYSEQFEPQVLAPVIARVDYHLTFDMTSITQQIQRCRDEIGAVIAPFTAPVIIEEDPDLPPAEYR